MAGSYWELLPSQKKRDPNISKIDPGDSENAIGTRKATKIRRIGSKVTTRLSGRHPVLWSPPGSQVATRFSGYHPALRSPPGSLVTTRFLGYHPAIRSPPTPGRTPQPHPNPQDDVQKAARQAARVGPGDHLSQLASRKAWYPTCQQRETHSLHVVPWGVMRRRANLNPPGSRGGPRRGGLHGGDIFFQTWGVLYAHFSPKLNFQKKLFKSIRFLMTSSPLFRAHSPPPVIPAP